MNSGASADIDYRHDADHNLSAYDGQPYYMSLSPEVPYLSPVGTPYSLSPMSDNEPLPGTFAYSQLEDEWRFYATFPAARLAHHQQLPYPLLGSGPYDSIPCSPLSPTAASPHGADGFPSPTIDPQHLSHRPLSSSSELVNALEPVSLPGSDVATAVPIQRQHHSPVQEGVVITAPIVPSQPRRTRGRTRGSVQGLVSPSPEAPSIPTSPSDRDLEEAPMTPPQDISGSSTIDTPQLYRRERSGNREDLEDIYPKFSLDGSRPLTTYGRRATVPSVGSSSKLLAEMPTRKYPTHRGIKAGQTPTPISPVEGNPLVVPGKKPSLACHFCRKRKIACGAPMPGSTTCNQCERRSLKCEFPSESRRGMRKRGGSLPRRSESMGNITAAMKRFSTGSDALTNDDDDSD